MNPGQAYPPGTTSATGRRTPSVANCRILVVDDIEWNRALIGALLEEAGYHNVEQACDGEDALAKIKARPPDLVILDIMMPGIDGFEVCRQLRADHTYADMPVLIQTALSGVEDRNRAFEAGATDLVTKPLDRTELLARVDIHLENRALIRDLLFYRDRLERELDMARAIFEHLMPSTSMLAATEKASGLTIRSHILRSSELGGDIWGMAKLDENRFGIYMLDLSGCGVSAALNVCRLHTLVQEMAEHADKPAKFLAEINQRAHDLLIPGESAAMIYGVASPKDNSFTYACAGANPPLLLMPQGEQPRFGLVTGLPLGVAADVVFEQQDLPFPPGSAVLFYSNTILDAIDNSGAPCASDSLANLVSRAASNRDLARAFDAIAERLDSVVGNPPKDDHTLVWLNR